MTTETNKTSTKPNTSPKNGETDPATAPATAASAPDKKPVTVMVTEALHRKAKITAELSGKSLSDLVEAQLKIVVKEKLPGLLAGLDTEG